MEPKKVVGLVLVLAAASDILLCRFVLEKRIADERARRVVLGAVWTSALALAAGGTLLWHGRIG